MSAFGDCLSCQMLGVCSLTDLEKVRSSYTCVFFRGVPEPMFLARVEMMKQFGETMAIKAMLTPTEE